MTTKEQTDYYEIIGKTEDGDVVMLDYVFKHADGFKGATGTSFRAIPKTEYQERKSPEYLKDNFAYLWREEVASGKTEQGLNDWLDAQNFSDDFSFDLSYCTKWDRIREVFPEYADENEYPIFECVGGGRMFPVKLSVTLREDLVKVIAQYEGAEQ